MIAKAQKQARVHFIPDLKVGVFVTLRTPDVIKRVIYGDPSLDDIETTNVENFNGILRGKVGRLVRRSKCYSKKKSPLDSAIAFVQFYWNMIHVLPNKLTPAMIESISDHRWTWNEFLTYHYAI